jgi:tetratricopeptide (TPR) repeat protein
MMWILIYLLILASTVAAIRFARQRARRLGADPLVVIRRKVATERRLARKNPAPFAPDLALSLATLSQTLRTAGDHSGALKARREATEIGRGLARTDPATFEPHLATHLFALAPLLSGAGDRGGALLANQEGTEIFRRLAESDPAKFEASLTKSLSNLAVSLGDVGDQGAAVTAVREAIEIGRRLARTDPARFEPDLATYYLRNLSGLLHEIGDHDGALAAIREAVEIHRRLIQVDSVRFESDLATSLTDLSYRLGDAGDRDEAQAAIREVGQVRRRLARVNRARSERAAPRKDRSLRFTARKLRTGLWILAYRLVLHGYPNRPIDGAWVGPAGLQDPKARDVIDEALNLIKRHDPLRYARLTRDVKRVVISALPGDIASFEQSVQACALDERFVAAHASQPEIIAAVIVHEATHARLMRCGVGYEEALRSRVEAVCARRERAFAAKLPNGQLVSEQAERTMALAPETFTDAAKRERDYKGDVAMFSYLGFPTWLATAAAAWRRLLSRLFARCSNS